MKQALDYVLSVFGKVFGKETTIAAVEEKLVQGGRSEAQPEGTVRTSAVLAGFMSLLVLAFLMYQDVKTL